jgi:hypothetical protein
MKVEFYLAEVVSIENTYEYNKSGDNKNDNNLFSVTVKIISDTPWLATVRPANPNIKQIPVIGEQLLIFPGGKETQVGSRNSSKQWYYFPAYSIESSIHENSHPGLAITSINDFSGVPDSINDRPMGNTFEDKTISPLQPFEGDVLVEGRWGNSIRLGSSISNDVASEDFYTLNPTWKSTNENRGDPIIILSNKRNNKPGHNEFVIEDIKKDGASLYLTSTQNFPNFTLSKPLGNYGSKSESEYNSPQLIGSADRIILQAKKDIIALDAKTRVTINTPELKIGDESACEAMVHGDVLMSILMDILNVISAGSIGTAGITTLPLDKGALSNAFKQLQYLNSSKYFIKRDS